MAILNIGLDLGSDAVKLAFAYATRKGVAYGKLARGDFLTQVAIPAVAYYDAETGKWLYGDEVERGERSSFVTVVKIKSLISLLESNGEKEATLAGNARYYRLGNDFPKFYFPLRKKMSADFGEMVKNDNTFRAEGYTPQRVAEEFFFYLRSVVEFRIRMLAEKNGTGFEGYNLAVVYPPKVGAEYVGELVRLMKTAFGSEPVKVLSSTKALGMFAYARGMLSSGESILVFDMGDENISAARASLVGETLVVDGADGHSAPLPVGGRDVDEAVASYIESEIGAAETVGTPSFGADGHIRESGLYSKQYLFMKEIKKAKIVLSRPIAESELFENGVPVAVNRDVYIQRRITRKAFSECLGIGTGKGLAETVASYIINEIKLPANRGVRKVFLSGGLTETYALLEDIKERAEREARGITIGTFDDGREDDDGFTILSHEDSVYAPAVGGAIVALKNYDVRTAIALSYGTWAIEPYTNRKVLAIYVNRGTLLNLEGPTEYYTRFHVEGAGVEKEEMFSVAMTKTEMQNRMIDGLVYGNENKMVVGEAGSQPRLKAEVLAGLKTVAGGADAQIDFYYRGRRVELRDRIYFKEGIRVDPDGHAVPFVKNDSAADDKISVRYWNETGYFKVKAREIEFRFRGLNAFTVVAGE